MRTNRLEACSDGVIAVIITIMVLEMKAPHDAIPLAFFSVLLADALFVLVALMWFIPDRRIEQALGI